MHVEIKLKDSRFCDGCSCMHWEGPTDDYLCVLNYWDYTTHTKKKDDTIRPQSCIDKHGE